MRMINTSGEADLVCVLLHRDGDGTAESEVSDLERHGLAVHEQVVGFEITVQHPAAVDESHALAQLVHQDLRTHSQHQSNQAGVRGDIHANTSRAQGMVGPLGRVQKREKNNNKKKKVTLTVCAGIFSWLAR